jgi:hypothetical protein
MRVALVFDRPYVDAHPCFREMVVHFAAHGWTVDLFMLQSPAHPLPRFESDRIRILPLEKSLSGLLKLIARLSVPWRYAAVVATPQWPLYWAVRARRWGRYSVTCLSDEIYTWDEAITPSQKKWKAREARAHRAADLTVSLSETRMRQVAQENRLPADHPYVVIPNAPSGRAWRAHSTYYRDRFSIPATQGILVHSGTLYWKLASQLARFAANWSEPWAVVFQGRFTGANMEPVPGPAIHYEQRVLPAGEMHDATSSADIGLALYDRTDPQERRNGETPGKLGLYLSCALPVICGNIDSLRWVADEKCGEWVADIREIPAAAARIAADYESYSRNAARVFHERFEYGAHFEPFLTKLCEVGALVGATVAVDPSC